MTFDKSLIASFPKSIGVYLMKDKHQKVLYVGKAKNLRQRIKQYFLQHDERSTIAYLIPQIASIDTIVVTSEKEALLLENTLIKKHKPKYNILLKDDKTFISLMITDHKWPSIRLVRCKNISSKDNHNYFGPYTNARAAKATLDLILHLFPLRQCPDSELASRKRPCILYEIKKCIAPCAGKCLHKEYIEYVERIKKILKGQEKEILKELKIKMQKAAEALEFEKAQHYQRLQHSLRHLTQIQHVDNQKAKECDVIGLYRHNDLVIITQLFYRFAKLTGSRHFTFANTISTDDDLLHSFLLQQYYEKPLPKEILLPLNITHKKELEQILCNKKAKTHLFFPIKGEKKKLIALAIKNAKALFEQEQNQMAHLEKLLLTLQEQLSLLRYPRHIECFDISHLAETAAIAAKVSFIHGKKEKNFTRYFKIKTKEKGDCPALRHVLERHLIKAKEENHFCDLLLIDGGKGQLNAARQVLQKLNITSIDVVAISKERALHTKGLTQEKIYLPQKKDPIILSPHSPLLFFLQKIRDDAHITAISFHRRTRKSKTIKTELLSIPGIGSVKSKKLLQTFKSVENIKKASTKDLEKTKFLNKKDIEAIRQFFHK